MTDRILLAVGTLMSSLTEATVKRDEEEKATATSRADYTLSDFLLLHCNENYMCGLLRVSSRCLSLLFTAG